MLSMRADAVDAIDHARAATGESRSGYLEKAGLMRAGRYTVFTEEQEDRISDIVGAIVEAAVADALKPKTCAMPGCDEPLRVAPGESVSLCEEHSRQSAVPPEETE